MIRKIIEPWLAAEAQSINHLHARDIGFEVSQLPPKWQETFLRTLCADQDARRLVAALPKCNVPMFAGFVVMTVATGPHLEDSLLKMTQRRGRGLVGRLRAKGREAGNREKAEIGNSIRRAERAFDTRRRGLIEYVYPLLVVRNYLKFRTGYAPTARELSALLKAAMAAAGRPAFQQVIDYDLLHRNLRNFEMRHPEFVAAATGERCAALIELDPPLTKY